jgi:REP element-mobilizing transposase RayT
MNIDYHVKGRKASVRSSRRPSGEPEQLVLFKQRGGKRRGAGRPPKGYRAGEPHKARPFLHERYPVHVVLRVAPAVGSLRRLDAYRAVREATLTAAMRGTIRIVHVSLQRTHLHMLVEAKDKAALASGMQGFQVSAAKHLNSAIGKARGGRRRRGAVFPDRYHAEIITSPTQARHTISYILSNWRHHQEDRGELAHAKVDPFSSAIGFPDWAERADKAFLWRGPEDYDPLIVYQPKTWMLKEGWKKVGVISYCEVPSSGR